MATKVCATCKLEKPENTKRLAVDHCHTTGVVRGLLCHKCNKALGVFNNKELLDAAINYLNA